MTQSASVPGEHPAVRALARLDEAVQATCRAAVVDAGRARASELRVGLEATRSRLCAVVLVTTREVDTRGAATATGAATTAVWLRSRLPDAPRGGEGRNRAAR